MAIILQQGLVCYTVNAEGFSLYKILVTTAEEILAMAYWPSSLQPTALNLANFEVRAHCLSFSISEFTAATAIIVAEISEEEKKEVAQFERIRLGVQLRENEFQRLLAAGTKAFENGDYETAITRLSEAAPYAKYTPKIYELRGKSYMQVGQQSDALADLIYACDLGVQSEEINALIAQLKGN